MPRYPRADHRPASAARLLPSAIVLLFVSAMCGGYGVQLAQRNGFATASFTLALAGIVGLVALIMLVIAIMTLRAGRRELRQAEAARRARKGLF